MFSPAIVESDAFVEMPVSSQALYFHLGMYADDDGFVNPKKIMRIMGAGDDDLKVIIAKRFVLPFESGVVVIKHWLIHNLIRADLYKETLYKDEKAKLGLNKNGAYTELREGVNELKQVEAPEWLRKRREDMCTVNVTQTVHRLGKVRLGKVRLEKEKAPASGAGNEIAEIITLFKEVNPSIGKYYANKTQRAAVDRMLKLYGKVELAKIISVLPEINQRKYWPKSTTPLQLEDNLGKYKALSKEKSTNGTAIII